MKRTVFFNILLAVAATVLCGCVEFADYDPTEREFGYYQDEVKIEEQELRPLEKLFISGFTMVLEDIYVMSAKYTDDYVDNMFKNGKELINIGSFETTNYMGNYVMYGLYRGMEWKISPMRVEYERFPVYQNFGSAIVSERVIAHSYNDMYIDGQLFKFDHAQAYTYLHPDNYMFNLKFYDETGEKFDDTNLTIEIPKEYNGEDYIFWDTNEIMDMVFSYSEPLTSDQVEEQIKLGNYEAYLYDGKTLYKIGENLYIVRYNKYVYYGTTNSQGGIRQYTQKWYRFLFRIVKN
jgi:hypothetical protein